MLILALDTSSPAGSLAFLRDDSVIGTIGTTSGEIYSSRVFRHLDFLLSETSLRLEDFDLFAVAAGPGSFTGLRVGLAAVKGWSEVFRKPIAAISGLEAISAVSGSHSAAVVPVMDARRNELYWGVYARRESGGAARFILDGDECSGPRAEFAKAVGNRARSNEDLTIATPAPELVSALLPDIHGSTPREKPIIVERVSPFLAPEIGRLGWIRAQEGKLCDSLTLDANYIRRSDAELHYAPKHKSALGAPKGSAGS